MAATRVLTSEIVEAYLQTGSVWQAGEKLGLSGQQVHARLTQIGHPVQGRGREWTAAEEEELGRLVGLQLPFLEIAARLDRSYNSVAVRASRLGFRTEKTWLKKIPRGQGYDKKSMQFHWKAFRASDLPVTKYVRSVNLKIENFVRALEKHLPAEWQEYKRDHYSEIEEKSCPYCGRLFYPSNGKQQWCTRTCGSRQKTDRTYFGGRRKETIGIVEGICQLCGGMPEKGLSSHHALGKENDPGNEYLVALCRGCHDVVTRLAAKPWVMQPDKLESLLCWVWIRVHGARLAQEPRDVWAAVEIWEEDLAEDPMII